jgi:cupin 2 domain-containing protein
MAIEGKNVFRHERGECSEEIIETLLQTDAFRLERIVSAGHRTPDGEWYDQDRDEWVVMLTGRARLRFEDPSEEIALSPGDCLILPRHRRHRVEWTDPGEPTVWLAIHYLR